MSSLRHAAHERFWRSVEEISGEAAASGPSPVAAVHLERRRFVQTLGAALALAGASGCSRPPLEKIVPYRDGPPQATYGTPAFYASTLTRDGYGAGVLVECNMGRPTKIEGNPAHPASLGATDVFAQAAVLDLWDPDRSQSVRRRGEIASFGALLGETQARLRDVASRNGAGLRIVTGSVTSPTLRAQLDRVLARYREARWHQWQPLNRDNVYAGARAAYGAPYEVVYRFDRTRTIVAFDADFLDTMPGCVRYASDFAATRSALATQSSRSRLYVVESTPTLAGANADHRLPLRAGDIGRAMASLSLALDGKAMQGPLPTALLQAMVADLQRNRGASVVVAGERQPPAIHALAHAINDKLGNVGTTVALLPALIADAGNQVQSLAGLVDDMREGRVETLVIVDVNPVYAAPADLGFADALQRVAFKLHLGPYVDETAARCDWHVSLAHALESWGDARAFDGTASLQQPCIAPLYGGRSSIELVATLAGDANPDGRALVRATWQKSHGDRFDAFFDEALRTGVIAGSASTPVRPRLSPTAAEAAMPAVDASTLELVLVPDPRVGDGCHANNAWLQELPKPLTQLTWDNAALVSPMLAARLGLANEDVVEMRIGTRSVEAPVWVTPGMPETSVSLALGHGRSRAGSVGTGVGANAYLLQSRDAPWFLSGLTLHRTGRRQPLACTQTHSRMEGRDLIRTCTSTQAAACASSHTTQRSLYDAPPSGPYAWAMSIDLSSCIGCGACTIACQAENNIAVVGRDEVRNGREMHWIRVDRYYEGSVDNPRAVFQPVPCMQCEHAPCEVVCPVEASVHDAQGINVQVYNRCVGTRFCSNNCPYKVRRFNFFQYAKDVPTLNAQRNPKVTVRMRGVMEKCNYCLQRITTAKIAADREGRRLRDGEVVSACQAVCPTRAIVFGDLNDPDSEVNRRKRSPLDYALLAELNTRPRTSYLARVTNPAADLPP
jgi:molybdopterin-containing oxidoreductase family iron-sulfur binding subunit